ncbi:hypothetical protein D9M71_468960 [compost metagenome]
MHGVADLQTEETDRANGAGDHGDDRSGIGQGADWPIDGALAEQRVEQGARGQGQAFVVMQVHQYDRQQAAEYCPGEKAPVDVRLRQCGIAGSFGIRLHASEQRRRAGEMHQGLGRGPEGATTGEQGAHDHGDPVEGATVGALVYATQAHPAAFGKADAQADQESQQHQYLPIQAKEPGRPGKQGVDQVGDTGDVDQGRDQEGAEEATADQEQRPVDFLFGCKAHWLALDLQGAGRFHCASWETDEGRLLLFFMLSSQ